MNDKPIKQSILHGWLR